MCSLQCPITTHAPVRLPSSCCTIIIHEDHKPPGIRLALGCRWCSWFTRVVMARRFPQHTQCGNKTARLAPGLQMGLKGHVRPPAPAAAFVAFHSNRGISLGTPKSAVLGRGRGVLAPETSAPGAHVRVGTGVDFAQNSKRHGDEQGRAADSHTGTKPGRGAPAPRGRGGSGNHNRQSRDAAVCIDMCRGLWGTAL